MFDPIDYCELRLHRAQAERVRVTPTPRAVPDKWFGGRTKVTDAILRGHPTRADEKLRKF